MLNKLSFLILLIVFLSSGICKGADKDFIYYKVNTQNLNIRIEASSKASIITTLSMNRCIYSSGFSVINEGNEWELISSPLWGEGFFSRTFAATKYLAKSELCKEGYKLANEIYSAIDNVWKKRIASVCMKSNDTVKIPQELEHWMDAHIDETVEFQTSCPPMYPKYSTKIIEKTVALRNSYQDVNTVINSQYLDNLLPIDCTGIDEDYLQYLSEALFQNLFEVYVDEVKSTTKIMLYQENYTGEWIFKKNEGVWRIFAIKETSYCP